MHQKKKKLLFLGAGPWQGWAIRTAARMGVETVIVDGNPQAMWRGLGDRFFHVDIKDEYSVLKVAREERVDGVLAVCSDVALQTLKFLLYSLRLSGPSPTTIDNTADKYRMHVMFDRHGIPSPPYCLFDNGAGAEDAAFPMGFPVIFKPLDNAGGRGITVVTRREEIGAAYAYTRQFSRRDTILVEKFIDGRGIGAEVVVQGGGIVQCVLMDDHYIPEYISPIGHALPTSLDAEGRETILRYIQKICTRFDLVDGNFNVDMKWTGDGPVFIEINPRMGGSNISELVFYSTGIDLAEYAVRQSLGEAYDYPIRPLRFTPAVSVLLHTRRKGTVTGVSPFVPRGDGKDALKEYVTCLRPGDAVRPHERLVTLTGWAIAASPSQETNWRVIEAATAHEQLAIDDD